MYRAIVVTFGVLIIFAMVFVVTLMARKKQINNINPYNKEFQLHQNDIINNGYDISYNKQPPSIQKGEDLIYQLNAKMSDINFEHENPETEPEFSTIWITNERLIVERKGKTNQNYSFIFSDIHGFEFELKKNKSIFLFDYKDQTHKFEIKDMYSMALIELKIKSG
ncbi:MAG: hypothetical protein HRT98_03200 [Mycoplasmatales bacterium]|nr:hypothetical protein [Mycoplasmatales bacterium]